MQNDSFSFFKLSSRGFGIRSAQGENLNGNFTELLPEMQANVNRKIPHTIFFKISDMQHLHLGR
jgi:hypothetical protein